MTRPSVPWWLAALFLASTAAAQDLAPETILLARIKAHIGEEIAHLPNYTCLETISRYNKPDEKSAMKPLDTVRLEVVYSEHGEWFGSPGDRNLGISNPMSFVGSGLMGSGVFATSLHNILTFAHFEFHGRETQSGRSVVQYDFQFARQPPAFGIQMPGGSGNVGQKGAMWVDEKSLDLIRLEGHAAEIPEYLPLAEQSTIVNYARMQIGEATALLAQQADLRMAETTGVDNFDHFEFSNCRAYSAESVISFGGSEAEGGQTARPSVPQTFVIPALLKVTVRLSSPVSNGDPVGKLIEGSVAGDVTYKGKVLLRDGDTVRGRIRRLERFVASDASHQRGKPDGDYIVGLEFTEVETAQGRATFYADLLSMDKNPAILPSLGESVSAGSVKIILRELPGVASFFVRGAEFVVPAGFGFVWRTRGPIRGQ